MTPSPPRPLDSTDDTAAFDCGNEQLNSWLARRAWANERHGDSRTYVSIDPTNSRIAGFYALASRSIARGQASGQLARNAPGPIPTILLGQLATSIESRGLGLGRSLFIDAVRKTQAAARLIGARALITEAIDDQAAAFYRHLGMKPLNAAPHLLYLPLRVQSQPPKS